MPTYCYRRLDTGEIVEITMSIQEMIRRQDGTDTIELEGGVRAVRDLKAEHGGYRHCPGTWPMVSYAAGVLPEQAKEAYEHSVKIGIPTEFNSDGDAIFRSAQHRKRYCEAIGLYDRNGGYSDPQRRRS